MHLNESRSSICDSNDSSVNCNRVECQMYDVQIEEDEDCLYRSFRFWAFVLLMSMGSIGFNVANSISDAICFDVLGKSCKIFRKLIF